MIISLNLKYRELSLKRKALVEAVKKNIQQVQSMKDKEVELELKEFKVTASWYSMFSLLGLTDIHKVGARVTDFVEILQGVTWGGKGAEDVFVLSEKGIKEYRVESEITFKCIGGEDITRWHVEWKGRYLLFPYITNRDGWSCAFEVKGEDITKVISVKDSLDFEHPIDDEEREIIQQGLSEDEKINRIINHRIALGLIKYPNAATYLAKHYQLLRGRIFEDKTLQQYKKMWYEYHRPRKPILIRKPKIVGPRLTKIAKFALDTEGFLPRDSVVAIVLKQKDSAILLNSLSRALNRKVSEEEALLYILAFLNSENFNRLLAEKLSKKRGGYPIVDEKLLQRLNIVIPTSANKNIVEKLIESVKKAVYQGSSDQLDKEINDLVKELYQSQR